uniref:Uncharacterized protein n=1 Tax=Anopheles melas TaxID=34690 RepID=A0A182TQT9_9DIPT
TCVCGGTEAVPPPPPAGCSGLWRCFLRFFSFFRFLRSLSSSCLFCFLCFFSCVSSPAASSADCSGGATPSFFSTRMGSVEVLAWVQNQSQGRYGVGSSAGTGERVKINSWTGMMSESVKEPHTSATYEVSRSIDDASIEGFLPSWIVVLSVPEESWRATTGDRPPAPPARGDDLGEYCSTFRNGSEAIVLPRHSHGPPVGGPTQAARRHFPEGDWPHWSVGTGTGLEANLLLPVLSSSSSCSYVPRPSFSRSRQCGAALQPEAHAGEAWQIRAKTTDPRKHPSSVPATVGGERERGRNGSGDCFVNSLQISPIIGTKSYTDTNTTKAAGNYEIMQTV